MDVTTLSMNVSLIVHYAIVIDDEQTWMEHVTQCRYIVTHHQPHCGCATHIRHRFVYYDSLLYWIDTVIL